MGRTRRKDRIWSSRTILDYFKYSRFSALFDASASCSALLEHTMIVSITAESHIEPIKTKKQRIIKSDWVKPSDKPSFQGVWLKMSFLTGTVICLIQEYRRCFLASKNTAD